MNAKPEFKKDAGKPPIGLIPSSALEEEAKVLAFGAKKYSTHGWRNAALADPEGAKFSRLIDAILRHILAFKEGEDFDPIDGNSHLGSIRADAGFLIEFMAKGMGSDDRWKHKPPQEQEAAPAPSHAALLAEAERYKEAWTPGGDTKAAYNGFSLLIDPDAVEIARQYIKRIAALDPVAGIGALAEPAIHMYLQNAKTSALPPAPHGGAEAVAWMHEYPKTGEKEPAMYQITEDDWKAGWIERPLVYGDTSPPVRQEPLWLVPHNDTPEYAEIIKALDQIPPGTFIPATHLNTAEFRMRMSELWDGAGNSDA